MNEGIPATEGGGIHREGAKGRAEMGMGMGNHGRHGKHGKGTGVGGEWTLLRSKAS